MRDLSLLPKAHLHVHLESTVRWQTLREIGAANGVPVPEHLAAGRTRFANFRDFADQNALVRACLKRPEDFTRVAREFCEDAAGDGTAYAEVTFTAAAHGERLGDPSMPLEAVLAGLREGEATHGVTTGVLLDHSRRRPVERARRTVDLALRHRDDGVLGWGTASACWTTRSWWLRSATAASHWRCARPPTWVWGSSRTGWPTPCPAWSTPACASPSTPTCPRCSG